MGTISKARQNRRNGAIPNQAGLKGRRVLWAFMEKLGIPILHHYTADVAIVNDLCYVFVRLTFRMTRNIIYSNVVNEF